MNYIVMLGSMAIAFCQTEEAARAAKPDLPGAAVYRAAGVLDELEGSETVELFGRNYVKLP